MILARLIQQHHKQTTHHQLWVKSSKNKCKKVYFKDKLSLWDQLNDQLSFVAIT
jgi:hypothetical protein